MVALLPLLVACEPDVVIVDEDGIRVVIADVEDLVLAKTLAVTLDDPAEVALSCMRDDDDREVHELTSSGISGQHELALYGLRADTTYTCAVSTSDGEASFALETAPLPDWAPDWTLSGETEGYTLFNHLLAGLDATDQKLLLVDPAGDVRWYYVLPEQVAGDVDSRYLGDGTFLYGGGYGARPRRIDLTGETVWRGKSPHLGRTHHHHVEALDDGRVMSLVSIDNTAPEEAEAWTGFAVEVIDPETDTLDWSWNSQALVDAGQLHVPGSDRDPYHANTAWWTEDDEGDALYVSLRDVDAWVRLDRSDGTLSWWLGAGGDFELLDRDGEPADDADWFYFQHAPELTGDTLVVYDNGFGRPGGGLQPGRDVPGRRAGTHRAGPLGLDRGPLEGAGLGRRGPAGERPGAGGARTLLGLQRRRRGEPVGTDRAGSADQRGDLAPGLHRGERRALPGPADRRVRAVRQRAVVSLRVLGMVDNAVPPRTSMTLLQRVGEWAAALRIEDVPPRVVDKLRMQVATSLTAAAWAPWHAPSSAVLVARRSAGDALVLATGDRVAPADAAFVNAAFAMALDHDDYMLCAHTGYSSVLAPLPYATELDGLLVAAAVANELSGRLSTACLLGPLNGQMSSYVHNAGAALAVGRVRGLPAEQLAAAVALALYQPNHCLGAGFWEQGAKTLTASLPLEQGIRAVDLAAAGLTAPMDLLEHPQGFF